MHVRIIDPRTRQPQAAGAEGGIAVKGTCLMKGYLKVAPEQCFDVDGFFHTGDAGFVDEHGLLHWTGRTDDLIKTAGANVSPVEIETVLLEHPDLKAALALAVPHPTLGEMVVLAAVAHEGARVTEADVQGFLRGRIASYKIPRRALFFEEADLRQALELPREEPAIVVEAPGEPPGPPQPMELHMDPERPEETWVIVRPWLLDK